MINKYNFDEFEQVSRAEWMAKLNQDLGEEIAAKISKWDCERNLSLSSYYDRNDVPANSMASSPNHSPWKYLQSISASDNHNDVIDVLMNGADGLILNDQSLKNIEKLFEQVAPEHCTISLYSAEAGSYSKLLDWYNSKVGEDSHSELLVFNGNESFDSTTSTLKDNFKLSVKRKHRVINLNGNLIQEKGGSAQLEIAYILSQAAHYINELLDEGYSVENIADSLIVSTAVGSNFFLELAKIRVIRKVVERVLKAYGSNTCNVSIHARTSRLTQSVLDRNTNYLRCTSEAMSAVLGGADYLTISPLHDLPSKSRIARNISNLLKEESLLAKTVDPSSGSYYIESLSDQLARKAWEQFQDIERNGGFDQAIGNAFFEEEIRKDWDFQMSRITAGNRKIVGVNDFGNQDEVIRKDELSHDSLSFSKVFENVRQTVEEYTQQLGDENRPIVYLLGVGSNAKMINARYTFVTNFFTWSGVKVKRLAEGESPKKGSVVVCCGADTDYTDEYLEKASAWNLPILAAGKSSPEASGMISNWINVKSDRLQTVKNVLAEMGVNQNTMER